MAAPAVTIGLIQFGHVPTEYVVGSYPNLLSSYILVAGRTWGTIMSNSLQLQAYRWDGVSWDGAPWVDEVEPPAADPVALAGVVSAAFADWPTSSTACLPNVLLGAPVSSSTAAFVSAYLPPAPLAWIDILAPPRLSRRPEYFMERP